MDRWLSSRVGYVLVCGLYLLSFPYHPGLRSPNELCRLWQSRALIDHETLHLNEVLQTHGMVGDLSCTAVVVDGASTKLLPCVGPEAPTAGVVAAWYYPSKAPLLSFLGAPVYWVLKKIFGPVSELMQVLLSRLFIVVLPTLIVLAFFRKFLSAYVAPASADLFTVVYALGTMAFCYSEAFMSHQLTAVLLFGAFYVVWKIERQDWRVTGYLAAGALAGAAVAAEYTAALGVVCIAAYTVASRWKSWASMALASGLVVVGAAPFLGGLMWYHHVAFGSPWVSGYKFLNDAAYMHWHQGGFLGIKIPDPNALFMSYFSPLRGLFALSPLLAVVMFSWRDVRRISQAYFVFLVVLLLAHSYFTSSFPYDSWGWTVGPRHLTGIIPFLILPVALMFERLKGSRWADLIAGLALSSVVATQLVSFVNYVPDNVSTSVWGLAVPMLADGYWPVSWLAGFVANPASGVLLVVLAVMAALWTAGALNRLGVAPWGLGVTVAFHLGVLRLVTPWGGTDGDRGAKAFLESVWVAPRGSLIPFRRP